MTTDNFMRHTFLGISGQAVGAQEISLQARNVCTIVSHYQQRGLLMLQNKFCSSTNRNRLSILIGAFLSALLVFIVFALSSTGNQFVALDDIEYIVENPHIATISWDNVIHTFTSVTNSNWHPLTTLTWMLDRQLWGLDSTGFIRTNCLIHAASVFMLCLLFNNLFQIATKRQQGTELTTGTPSHLMVQLAAITSALFFGLHPLRVESVVWASQRKDVLCLFFISLAVYFYLRTVDTAPQNVQQINGKKTRYYMTLSFAALALLSKPTALSLPLIMLLLDWYPLARISDRSSLFRCAVEKTPVILMACAVFMLTIAAQQESTVPLFNLPVAARILVAGKAVLFYIVKTIYPSGLSAIYYHPGNVVNTALFEYLGYALLAGLISLAAVFSVKYTRLWAALWLFYFITLVPTLGLIQVGKQWAADRYSYIPALSLSLAWGIVLIWLYTRIREQSHHAAITFITLAAICHLSVTTYLTVRQVGYWHDTGTLTTRIIEQSADISGDPYYYRALYRAKEGRYELALNDIHKATELAFRNAQTADFGSLFINKAILLRKLGRNSEALDAAKMAEQVSTSPLPDSFQQMLKRLR